MLAGCVLSILCTFVAVVSSEQQLPNVVAIVGQPFVYGVPKLENGETPSKVGVRTSNQFITCKVVLTIFPYSIIH